MVKESREMKKVFCPIFLLFFCLERSNRYKRDRADIYMSIFNLFFSKTASEGKKHSESLDEHNAGQYTERTLLDKKK